MKSKTAKPAHPPSNHHQNLTKHQFPFPRAQQLGLRFKMSVSPSRLLDLARTQCRIFNTIFNPDRLRTGNKILRQRLRGPAMAAYYPRRLATFKDLAKAYPGFEGYDEDEADREENVQMYAWRFCHLFGLSHGEWFANLSCPTVRNQEGKVHQRRRGLRRPPRSLPTRRGRWIRGGGTCTFYERGYRGIEWRLGKIPGHWSGVAFIQETLGCLSIYVENCTCTNMDGFKTIQARRKFSVLIELMDSDALISGMNYEAIVQQHIEKRPLIIPPLQHPMRIPSLRMLLVGSHSYIVVKGVRLINEASVLEIQNTHVVWVR